MKRIVAASMLSILLFGCASAPLPYLKGQGGWAADETGKQYCSRVSSVADSRAQSYLGTGIVTGILATASIIAGAAMGPDTSSDANWAEKNRNTLVLGSGAIVAIPATILLMRSRDSSTASATAGQAMGLDNDKAMSQCLQARADLVNARSQAADFARNSFAEKIKSLQEVKDKNEKEAADKKKEADNAVPSSEDQKQKQKEADDAAARAKAAGEKLLQELQQPPEKN